MATYLKFPLVHDAFGIARVFVHADGTDRVQVAWEKPGYPHVLHLLHWSERRLGKPYEVARFNAEDACEFIAQENKRLVEDAARTAGKAAS
jgi:hypothetical protein